jgi:RNA-binding protein
MTMLSKQQQRYLRILAQAKKPVVNIGKSGISGNLLEQVELALEAHELVKISVLETSPMPRDEVAKAVAEVTGAEIVQCIGRAVVLYRPSESHKTIELPVP